jgi:PAS domain S-box-containing protein
MDSAEMSRGPTEGASELDLEAWRQRALDRVLPAVAVVSLPAVVGGVWLSLAVGPWWIAPFDIVAWLVLAALAAGRGSYRLRASFVIGLVLVVGTVLIGALGPSGIGQIWLPPAPILGGLFFGRKGLLAWLLAVELAILGLSLAVPIGTMAAPLTTTATAWWVMAGAGVACVALLVGLPMVHLVEGLARSEELVRWARDDARRRQEAEVTERRRFEQFFAEMPAALLLVEAGGRILRCNHAARGLFGLGELGGTPIASLMGGPALGAIDATLADVATKAGDVTYAGAAQGRRADGDPLELELRIVAIDEEGRRAALIGALDVGARVAVERTLEQTLAEKVTLLQEVHHRVKNNLQIVSGLLDLQAATLTDGAARRALAESTQRVRSMALVHQHLYAGETFTSIDFAAYLRTVARGLQESLAPDAEIDFRLEPLQVTIEQAMPSGLILNELVTNALKHGRDPDGRCRVTIALARDAEQIRLSVRDDGPGLAEPWERLQRRSLGGRVVTSLARQLRAKLTASGPPGARFELVWTPGGAAVPERAIPPATSQPTA